MRSGWTAADVYALGVVTTVPIAGAVLGIGRTKSFQLARRGEFPVPVLMVGATYHVPTAPLRQLLGLEDSDGDLARPPHACNQSAMGAPDDNDRPRRAPNDERSA